LHAYLDDGVVIADSGDDVNVQQRVTWRQAVVVELGDHGCEVEWAEGSVPFEATWDEITRKLIDDAGGNEGVRRYCNIINNFDGKGTRRRMQAIALIDLSAENEAMR
jgi:hypothetical protein